APSGMTKASTVSQARWRAGSGSRTPSQRVLRLVIPLSAPMLLGLQDLLDQAGVDILLEGHGLLVHVIFDLELVHHLAGKVDRREVLALFEVLGTFGERQD